MFFTYILESPIGEWYYGHTNEIDQRLHRHNTNQNKSTRYKGPWIVIFLRPFDTKREANRFELHLKKLRNKDYILSKFAEYFTDAIR